MKISPWDMKIREHSHVVRERAEGPKASSPGQRPGYNSIFSKAPLQGDRFAAIKNPGRCPGLGASALYLSLRPVTVGSGRMGKTGFFKL